MEIQKTFTPSELTLTAGVLITGSMACNQPTPQTESKTTSTNSEYTFKNGYPVADTAQKAYDDADLNTAVEAYKFFYPSVSILATWKGNESAGVVPNKSFLILQGSPHQLVFTPNSDTPYEGANIDLSSGPMVVELPPGPLMCVVNDLNQRYVMDMGIPGPDLAKAESISSYLRATRARFRLDILPVRRPRIASCLWFASSRLAEMCRQASTC
jgi:hypothetical protein